MGMRWTPERLDQLESASRSNRRVVVRRRGNEFVVVALALHQTNGREVFVGRLPMTGDPLLFPLDDIESFEVLP